MFERFTKSARDAVESARRWAADTHALEIREEHIAAGVVTAADTPAVHALDAAGHPADVRAALRDDFAALGRRAGVTATDAEALRELGIDVDEVLDRMEEISTVPPRRPRGSRLRLFNRGDTDRPAVPWSDNAKQVLERALREAIDMRAMHIDDAHVLLALLSGDGVAAETMAGRGVSYSGIRRAVTDAAAS